MFVRGAIAGFRRLTWKERALFAEALLALACAAFAVAVVPFRVVMALVRPPSGNCPADAGEEAIVGIVRRAVGACSRRVPWRALCLEQALASHWMLRRRGIAATLHYGIARTPHGIEAHAWVTTQRFDVVGCENSASFNEIARFPARNAP